MPFRHILLKDKTNAANVTLIFPLQRNFNFENTFIFSCLFRQLQVCHCSLKGKLSVVAEGLNCVAQKIGFKSSLYFP